jgi:hypothetical protein
LPDWGKARGYYGGKKYGAPQVLTPPGAQPPATRASRRRENGLGMEVLQPTATPQNAPVITRNEQVSGSSSLVGSYFYLHLQVKRKEQKTSKVPYRCP